MAEIAARSLAGPQAAKPESLWLYRSHTLAFPGLRGLEADLLFASLSAKACSFALIPGALRQGKSVKLPLKIWRFKFLFAGELEQELLSAGHGERRQSALARIPLSSGASLMLSLSARQELVSGRVRADIEFWFRPGPSPSFRSVLAARLIRFALSRAFGVAEPQ